MPRILVADDDYIERKGILMLSARLFPEEDFRFLEAENGREALELALSERPDIILTDIRMPVTDGLAFLADAAKALPETVTIIISAYGEFEYAQTAIEYGVSHYLLKPLDPEAFLRVMESALAQVRPPKSAGEKNRARKLKSSLMSTDLDLRRSSAERVVGDVLEILHSEYADELSVESIAARLYLTPSYLSYIFRHGTGYTIVRYLVNLRLEKAKELLETENRKIADVALAAGYRDVSYFCAQFKNKYGMTPAQFRNRTEKE